MTEDGKCDGQIRRSGVTSSPVKTFLAPVLSAIALLAAGVVAVRGTLAAIHYFAPSESRTIEVVRPPEPEPPSAARTEPLSIVTAKYSYGSQSADVTGRVRELIAQNKAVWANPSCLHADPHPYMNKALVIIYTVEGRTVMLSVGENEKVNRARLLRHAQRESDAGSAQIGASH